MGDHYILGYHHLLCGDSTKQEDIEKLMGGEQAAMAFTDPPYNVNYEDTFGRKILNDNIKDFDKFLLTFYQRLLDACLANAPPHAYNDETSPFWNVEEARKRASAIRTSYNDYAYPYYNGSLATANPVGPFRFQIWLPGDDLRGSWWYEEFVSAVEDLKPAHMGYDLIIFYDDRFFHGLEFENTDIDIDALNIIDMGGQVVPARLQPREWICFYNHVGESYNDQAFSQYPRQLPQVGEETTMDDGTALLTIQSFQDPSERCFYNNPTRGYNNASTSQYPREDEHIEITAYG